jgi:hypothetical protein
MPSIAPQSFERQILTFDDGELAAGWFFFPNAL